MKNSQWFIYFVNPSSTKNSKTLAVGKTVFYAITCISFLGLIGLGRCVYFGVSYGMAKLGIYYNLKENRQLKQKLHFYQRFTQEKKEIISELVNLEDNFRVKFGLEMISGDVRKAGVGGRPGLDEIAVSSLGDPNVIKADSIKEKLSTLLRQTRLQDSTFNQVVVSAQQQSDKWAQRPSISPVWGRITSPFGYRIHPFTGSYVLHEGLDISGTLGTPIKSPSDGVVSFAGFKEYFGRMVMIDHPASGFKTVFAHLNKSAVVEGQAVTRGDIIGYMGTSGRSTGPHLHYEVHKNNDLANPMDFVLPTDTMVD